ncbi:unnamed protein product, partial [Echinostoma caproni]|uniref:BLVR domain-containing protein n=1 Tax=Echinostoma caproni TaxID=27848 RepID=A0A183AYT1_9TREM
MKPAHPLPGASRPKVKKEVQTEQYFYALSDPKREDVPTRKRRIKRDTDEYVPGEQSESDYDPAAVSRQKRRMKNLEEKLENDRANTSASDGNSAAVPSCPTSTTVQVSPIPPPAK